MTQILIYEPKWVGHHPVFLRLILDGLQKNKLGKIHVILPYTAQGAIKPSKDLHISFIAPPQPKAFVSKLLGSDIAGQFAHAFALRKFIESHGGKQHFDLVIIPYLDHLAWALSVLPNPLFGIPWMGIKMRVRFHLKQAGIIAPRRKIFDKIEKTLMRLMLKRKSFTQLWSLDPTLPAISPHPKLSFLPDPATFSADLNRQESRQKLGYGKHDKVILLYGALDERKGIDRAFKIIAHPACPKNIKLLMAGKLCPSASHLIDPQHDNLTLLNKHISDEQEADLFAACDAVWVVYQNHYGSSGVMIKSGLARKPVIATPDGLIGYWAQSHKLGMIWHHEGMENNMQNLVTMLEDSQTCHQMGEAGYQLFKHHTPNQMQHQITQKVKEITQHSQAPANPLISIVIPVYNRERIIADTIEAIFRQTYKNFEVIVVDDASTDKTASKIELLNEKLPITLIKLDHNQGPSGARNAGIKSAKGTWVAFLDSDDVWLPERLEMMVQRAKQLGPAYGVIYSGRAHMTENGGIKQIVRARREGDLLRPLLDVNHIPGGTAMVNKDLLELVDGFDETLRCAEDWDLFIRLAQLTYIGCVPDPLLLYRIEGLDRLSANPWKRMHGHWHIYRKYFKDGAYRPSSSYYFTLGDILVQRGKTKWASQAFRHAFRLRPGLKPFVAWWICSLGLARPLYETAKKLSWRRR